jgi:2',3'-cyclic-nucleotide 2'-phosphodiesterase (5'-nucleotidase family)
MQKSSKRVITLLVVAAMLISFLSFVAPVAKAEDPILVSSTNYGNVYLDTLAKHGVLQQRYPGGEFRPDMIVTRAQFVTLVVRSLSYDLNEWFNLKMNTFKDVPTSYWASPYIDILASRGFIKGYGDGTFRPDATISEEEAVVVLSRALGVKDFEGVSYVLGKFTDASLVSSWARDYLNFMVGKGILNGYSDNTLRPKASMTLAELAPIIVTARFPTVTILHTNDFHMYLLGSTDATTKKPIGGSARIATVVENERAYNPKIILVDAGDAIGGGPPIGAFFYGKDIIEVYNAIGYDYVNFGNHEFDWGKDLLKERISEAKYKYISANVIDTSTNSTFAPEAYTIKDIGFVKLGFYGLDTADLPVLVNPTGIEGLKVLDPAETSKNIVSTLSDKANYIVALSHLGYDQDQILAKDVSGINLIIGGHTHTVLTEPDIINGTYIVQTGNYGNNIGKVVLEFETTANSVKLLNTTYTLIPINDSIPEDQGIKALIAPYNDEVTKKMSVVIGEALVDLDGERANVRSKETNLGDFIADWMRNISGTDIAITNSGGIRASIPKGPITVGSVYTTIPFDNLLVKLELTGAQVVTALENGYSMVETAQGRFSQISGIRVKVDLKKPAGSRVVEVLVNGKTIELDKVYTVAVLDFMAAGGDGYAVLKEAKSSKWVTGNWMRDDLVDYIIAHPQVNVTVDGRITFVSP